MRRQSSGQVERYTFEGLLGSLGGFGMDRPITTWGDSKTEAAPNSFVGYSQAAYKANGIVHAVIAARMRLFCEARFQFQALTNGKPGRLFGTPALGLLETPWMNATTRTLLAHIEQDSSLAGNSYTARRTIGGRTELRRLRPDWVQIIVGSPNDDPDDIDAYPVGYWYHPKGIGSSKPVLLMPENVAHFAPTPDPEARFRGMSWLTPIIEEIRSDTAATRHKGKFFDNAATPNLSVAIKTPMTVDEFREAVDAMNESHQGVENAYKTLWTLGGADVQVIGADLKQLDFKATQGAGETRIAAAGGVPPIIVGLSEGLASATYSNYGQARRAFADLWARPQWGDVAGCLQSILTPPASSRLWYDDSGISFLQEDQKDAAEILAADAQTNRTLVEAGYEPASVVAAVAARDMNLLVHTGLVSVQLQTPGVAPTPAA